MIGDGSDRFAIIEGYERTAAYLEPLCRAADSHRDALGFFGSSVYEEFARDGLLYVLTREIHKQSTYAGHLLFSCRHPRAHVLQIFVLPEYQRGGKGGHLLNHLKTSLTKQSFISIYARVAEDLSEAN